MHAKRGTRAKPSEKANRFLHSSRMETVAGLEEGVQTAIRDFSDRDARTLTIDRVLRALQQRRLVRLENIFEKMAVYIRIKSAEGEKILNPAVLRLRGPVIDQNSFSFKKFQRVVFNQNLQPIDNSLQRCYCSSQKANARSNWERAIAKIISPYLTVDGRR